MEKLGNMDRKANKKIATHTLGCKVNQYETQAIIELFETAGYAVVSLEEPADVLVINTCTVTSISDKKSRQMIRRARKMNEKAVIAVTGCYAQLAPEAVKELKGVHVVAGTSERYRLLEAVEAVDPMQQRPVVLVKPHKAGDAFESLKVSRTKGMARAYVKVQDGCNQFCSYCIIPYARGPIRSRNKDEVISEVTRLVANGYQEVVLTGIHLASYGREQKQPDALIQLLETIDSIHGLKRMRLGSLEPTLIQPDFTQRLMKLNTLCHHFHLSLQSGCDKTLKAMNRKYSTDDYRQAVKQIREHNPEAAITTDMIVGFPGESGEDFEASLAFAREVNFSGVHVFRYSPRKGTPAALYDHQVPEETKHQRSRLLEEAAQAMKERYLQRFLGRQVKVLMEKAVTSDDAWMEGHTEHYTRVLVPLDRAMLHREIGVLIKEVAFDHCKGVVVP